LLVPILAGAIGNLMLHPSPASPMTLALRLAEAAAAAGEAPVGAVIVENGEVLAAERNRMKELGDPTAHAEMLAIRAALASRGTGRLDGCDLYVTLEPCAMCAGAIAHVRLRRLYFGAEDTKAGAVENGIRLFAQPSCHHRPEVIGGIGERRSAELLRGFFADRR
jgi:tRNA(adenine34) deaminase